MPKDLYIKLTSYKQKVILSSDINTSVKKLILKEYIFTGVPLNAGAPYSATFELNFGSRFKPETVRTDTKTSIALPLTDSYTFVQHPNGHTLHGVSDSMFSDLDIEIYASDGTAAQFTEAHLWFQE